MIKTLTRLTAAAMAWAVLCAGCGRDTTYEKAEDTPVVLTIEGTDVHAAQLAVEMDLARMEMEGEYNSLMGQLDEALSTNESQTVSAMWRDKELRGILRQTGTQEILRDFALEQLIEKHDLTLTQEEQDAVQIQMDYGITYFGSEEAMASALAQAGYTLDSFRQAQENQIYQSKLQKLYYAKGGLAAPSDQEVQESYENSYFHIRSLSIPLQDEAGNALSQRDQQIALDQAETFRSRLAAGEDFDTLQKEWEGRITGCTGNDRTLRSSYDLPTAYLTAAVQLEENEISQVIQDTDACYVLQRLPLDMDLLTRENSSQDGSDLLWNEISYAHYTMEDLLDKKAEELEVNKHMTYYLIKNTNYQKYLVG